MKIKNTLAILGLAAYNSCKVHTAIIVTHERTT